MSTSLAVRPILHTQHLDHYRTMLEATGMVTVTDEPGWILLQGGAGRIALHGLYDGVSEGQTRLGFEVADLTAYVDQVEARAPHGLTVETIGAAHGPAARVTGRDGLVFLVDQVEAPKAAVDPDPRVIVHQLWISPDVPQAADDLEALGCRKRYTETNGRTIDLDAGAGRVLVHTADGGGVGAVSAVDYEGDLEPVHAALLSHGIRHDVIDESHGRTLQVPMPGAGGLQFWITREDEDPVGTIRH